MLWGFIFPVWVPHAWSAWCGICSSPRLVPVEGVPPSHGQAWFLTKSLPFLVLLMWPVLCICLYRVCSASLFIFWIIYLDVGVIWVYLWEEVSLGSSFPTIFLRSLVSSLFIMLMVSFVVQNACLFILLISSSVSQSFSSLFWLEVLCQIKALQVASSK